MSNVKNEKEIRETKYNAVMTGIARWTAFFRKNPHRFAKMFLNIDMKTFQKIDFYQMFQSSHYMEIASRGQGKTWKTAAYSIVRCLLYPGTKICIASGTKKQATEVIQKIQDEFLKEYGWGSDNLANEISFISTNTQNARCDFKNGSWIKAVTSTDNARGAHCTVLILDEFRMISEDVLSKVLTKFLTIQRHPGYLSKPEYAHLTEENLEIYLTSAWHREHWSYKKALTYYAAMLDGRKYFFVSHPYQIAIKNGLLSRERVEDEMSEATFNELDWEMEMECKWQGGGADSFFQFDDFYSRRKIRNAFYPLEIYERRGINIPELAPGERRILSVDVALMQSGRFNNDAAGIVLNCAIPNGQNYKSNFVLVDAIEGSVSQDLALEIARRYHGYGCTDLVLDAQGNGLPIYDLLTRPQFDPLTGATYPAMKSCNNAVMAERCSDKSALKVIWTIKASADFNDAAANQLRAGVKNGNVNLLIDEEEAKEIVKKIPGYKSQTEHNELLVPYIQTSMFINEAISLKYKYVNDKIKLYERSDSYRKDRFSALEYNYYVTTLLANELKPATETVDDILDKLKIRRGSIRGRKL